MAELVYALGLGSSEATHEGSSPFIDTMDFKIRQYCNDPINTHRLYEPAIFECPFAEDINPKLMEWIKSNVIPQPSNDALMTSFEPTKIGLPIKELKVLFDWINSVSVESSEMLARGTGTAYHSAPPEYKNFEVADYWGMWYNEGDFAEEHNHFPYSMSFAYYVNCPEGSSPLVLEGNEIQVTEGRLIMFAGHQNHKVDPCPVNNRFMIAGNIAYLGFVGDNAGVVQR